MATEGVPAEVSDDPTGGDAPPPAAPKSRRRLPVGVMLLAALGILQGLALLAIGVLVVITRSEPDMLDAAETTAGVLLAVGIVVVALGLISVVLGIALARGSRIVQTFYAALATFQVASSTYTIVAVPGGRAAAIPPLCTGLLILWLLYGSERTQEFFGHG